MTQRPRTNLSSAIWRTIALRQYEERQQGRDIDVYVNGVRQPLEKVAKQIRRYISPTEELHGVKPSCKNALFIHSTGI